jgi:hypothetical protein
VLAFYEENETEPSLMIQAAKNELEAFSSAHLEAWMKYIGVMEDANDYRLNIAWYGQFNTIFKTPCGCWPDTCKTKTIKSNICCNRAANKILETAGAHTDLKMQDTITSFSNGCDNTYATSGLTGNVTEFNKAIQTIDTSLYKHMLPIMVGVQHPYWDNSQKKWYYKCGSTENNPRSTNHFIVIMGKGYDENKKMWFYYFYEVAAENTEEDSKGKSRGNTLWIDTNNHLIKGNVAGKEFENYYIVTSIRKNKNQIYNYK